MPRGLRWLGARWLPLLSVAVWALAENPLHYARECAAPADLASIQERDRAVLAEKAFWVASDNVSYAAMAERPFSDDYLVRRSPYCYRVVAPLLASGLSRLGLGVCWSFWFLSLLSLAAAALGLVELGTTFGLTVGEGCFAALLFVSGAKTLNTFASVLVDPGAWAAMFWAWTAWRRRALGAAFVLGCLSVAWRETSIFLMVPIAVDALRERDRRVGAAIVGAGTLAVVAALHALLPPPSNRVSLHYILVWAAMALRSALRELRTWLPEYALGLGVAASLLPVYVRSARSSRFLSAELYLLTLVLFAFPFEIGRLMVPGGAIVAVLAVHALRAFPRTRGRVLGGAVLGGACLVVALWLAGRGAFYAWTLVVTALAIASNVMLPKAADRPPPLDAAVSGDAV
ncbi:MAG TPA: hypothetical protein VHL80_10110 [Polyangia bacterium]|nr:hypothetical protein [Polyangia bacterium]